MSSHRCFCVSREVAAVLVFAISLAFGVRVVGAQDPKAKDGGRGPRSTSLRAGPPHTSPPYTTKYPQMAAIEEYLMTDRAAEVALARSAAPEAVSKDATVMVLGRHGYETAAEGKNGFVCVVERGWMSPGDAPEFWNPKLRGPICFNPPAARSVLPTTYKRTEMVLAGKTKAEIIEGNKAAFEKGELPALEAGAMSFMLSKDAYLTDSGSHNLAHLMIYAPPLEGAAWGADLPKSPVMLIQQFKGAQPIDVFIVPVGKWSDGTAAGGM